jgi:ABC-type glycerol-3-phosphate transport system permease component
MSSMILLVGAVFASLAFGVLLAYAICQMMFRIFRVHAQSTARRSQAARVSASIGN